MSEVAAPLHVKEADSAPSRGRRRVRILVVGALAVLLVGGVFGIGATYALGQIHRLEHQRTTLQRENRSLASVKAHDEAALKASRSTLAQTSAQLATTKAKVAKEQAAVKQAQADASGQYVQGYSAGSGDSYNSGFNNGYNGGYSDGYNQGYYDGAGY